MKKNVYIFVLIITNMTKSIKQIVQIGNSFGVILPKKKLKDLDLFLGDEVEIVFNKIKEVK